MKSLHSSCVGNLVTPFRTLLAAMCLCFMPGANAQLTSSNFSLVPPLITESAPPNVMLLLSDDH